MAWVEGLPPSYFNSKTLPPVNSMLGFNGQIAIRAAQAIIVIKRKNQKDIFIFKEN